MKHYVDFGLYVIRGSINCQLAEKTGLTEEDAEKFTKALYTLFENDASSKRPEGSCNGRPYNVGSEQPYSISEIAKAVLRYTSAVGQIRVENSVVAGAPHQRYVPNIDRCKVELGVKETYSLEQAITRTFHYVGTQKTFQTWQDLKTEIRRLLCAKNSVSK